MYKSNFNLRTCVCICVLCKYGTAQWQLNSCRQITFIILHVLSLHTSVHVRVYTNAKVHT